MEWLIAASILFSAGTYLFDFVSNIVIAFNYGKYYFRLVHLDQHHRCNDRCKDLKSEFTGYFFGILGVFFFSHTLNALIFKFKVHKKDNPLKSAYFLPLIHLWRLIKLLLATLSCQRIKDIRSSELTGLFSILGTALEGMPMLILQFSAYISIIKSTVFSHDTTAIFAVSVSASLLSSAYNGGSAVESVMINVNTWKGRVQIGLSAGLFTASASITRCLTYVNIMVHMRDYFQKNRTARSKAKYHPSDSIPIVFLVLNITSYWLFYWLFQFPKLVQTRRRDLKKCLSSLVLGYMSIILGPLYPMASEAKAESQLGTVTFRRRLSVVGLVNLSVDGVVLAVTYHMGTLATGYLIVSVVGSAGYVFSLLWFILVDNYYGPVTSDDTPNSIT